MAQERKPSSKPPCNRSRSADSSKRLDDLAVRADPLRRLDHALVQKLGQHDAPVEQPRPGLGRDAQRIAKAAGHDQHGALTLALQERVGGHRRVRIFTHATRGA